MPFLTCGAVMVLENQITHLPGFYYDSEKNRYFRLLPGHNNCNPLTTEGIVKRVMEMKRLKHLEEDKNRKKSSRLGCNASLLLRKQQIGLLPSTTYCRQRHLTTASGRAAGNDVIADPCHMIGGRRCIRKIRTVRLFLQQALCLLAGLQLDNASAVPQVSHLASTLSQAPWLSVSLLVAAAYTHGLCPPMNGSEKRILRRMHELKISCMQKKDVSIINPEPLAEDTHNCEFIITDSSGQRLFSVNDLDNGYCKYGLLELNGLWKDIPTVENHETLFFSNQKSFLYQTRALLQNRYLPLHPN
ncbi:unnamed protein product, partial [Ranitomeya imitator]